MKLKKDLRNFNERMEDYMENGTYPYFLTLNDCLRTLMREIVATEDKYR